MFDNENEINPKELPIYKKGMEIFEWLITSLLTGSMIYNSEFTNTPAVELAILKQQNNLLL